MSTTSIFSLPLASYHQPGTQRRKLQQSKKRKRQPVENGNHGDVGTSTQQDVVGNNNPRLLSHQPAEYSAVLTPDERHQYRVSGHPLHEPSPKYPFPHAPQEKKDNSPDWKGQEQIQAQEGEQPEKALFRENRTYTLHEQHLAVISAILHRCLMQKDYVRAGRALGLILRDHTGGKPPDVRNEGRWGIGAEILLRRGLTLEQQAQDRGVEEDDGSQASPGLSRLWFTKKGFEDAKRYYERLIIQYPFHKHAAGAVNALDFYLAMFGLWVHVVHEEYKLQADEMDGPRNQNDLDMDTSTSLASSPSTSQQTLVTVAQERALGQARAISARMDSCMSSFPYSDSIELIRLRGMVALWIADLLDDLSKHRERGREMRLHTMSPIDDLTDGITRVSLDVDSQRTISGRVESALARDKAREMFDKLRTEAERESSEE